MEYIYKNNTFTPKGDIKIPDKEYILLNSDSFSLLILERDKFEKVIERMTREKESSPDIARVLRLILAGALQVTCEKGKIYYDGNFQDGSFFVEGENGFYIIKSSCDYPRPVLQNIIEKCLIN